MKSADITRQEDVGWRKYDIQTGLEQEEWLSQHKALNFVSERSDCSPITLVDCNV